MDKLIIRGARVIDPANDLDRPMDILIIDSIIRRLAPCVAVEDATVIDASGWVCAPGLVDMHVHLRDPGQTYKEDIISGCKAAAAGGVTSLACMPNTVPACDTPETISYIRQKAAEASARIYPVAAITRSLSGEKLTDFEALQQAGAIGFSDDGRPVLTPVLMKKALERAAACGLPVLAHCEEISLVRNGLMNEGAVSCILHVPGISRAAEDVGTAREIALAAATGCPVHICHVSTRGSVELLRDARRRGVPVTGETAPHYFYLTDERLRSLDADYRMNPPLRTEDDRNAVTQAICDGTLSAIATDHAPHTPQEKADFRSAPNGSVGLETSLAVGITALVRTGRLTLSGLISLMSEQPARLLNIPGGTLSPDSPADIVLFDPNERWQVDPSRLHGKSCNTPFKGETLFGKVKTTILNGRIVYQESITGGKADGSGQTD